MKATAAQLKVIERAKARHSNRIAFKVHEKTLIGMIRSGLVELFTQTKPYFLQEYRLTDKAISLTNQ